MTAGKWQYAKPKKTPGKVCVDCLADAEAQGVNLLGPLRPAPYPGPRCASHNAAKKRERRLAAANRRVKATYDLDPEDYDALYEFQGGRCALCRRARGTGSKRLAVDHDHHCPTGSHPHQKACRQCVRGLVCSTCNDILAHARDDHAFGYRMAAYLQQSPWARMQLVAEMWPPPGVERV